jgi:single-strand DNA-binding protein
VANSHETDVNQFELVGYVGRLRASATPGGREVANLSVGTHRMVREPETKRLVEKTEWHDVVAFDELALQVRTSVDKGTRVRVTGYMRTSKWADKKTGATHYKHELVAVTLEVPDRAGLAESPPAAAQMSAPVAEALGMKIRSF